MQRVFILRNEKRNKILLIPIADSVDLIDGKTRDEDSIIELGLGSIINCRSVEDAKEKGWELENREWTIGLAVPMGMMT